MSLLSIGIQRGAEHVGALLPAERRYRAERWVRGYLEFRRLQRADHAVISFGKSGRTWLRVLLSRVYQLAYDLPEELLEFDNLHRHDPAVPVVLFSHDNYLRDYTGDGGAKSAYETKRVVLLVRHPADVAVSQYFQWQHRMRAHKIRLNDYPLRDGAVTPYEFVTGPAGAHRIIGFMNEWAHERHRIAALLTVRYEDMRADTVRELDRLCRFLEIPGHAAHVEQAVEYGSFGNMRRREAAAATTSARLQAADRNNPDSFKSRRGKVGGYRDYLEPHQVVEVEDLVRRHLDPCYGYGSENDS